jgi:hypothetical protein
VEVTWLFRALVGPRTRRHIILSKSNQTMPTQCVAHQAQAFRPPVSRSDRRSLVQQPGALLLARQPLELRPQGVVGQEESLLAVEDRRIRARGVIAALDLAGAEIELDAPQQGRVGIDLEVGVDEVGHFAGMAMQLDQVRSFDLAEVSPGAALIDAEQ